MALHETLNLRKDEVVPVSILVFQSVFLGFFLGAFDVGANTLFLNSFDQAMIPKAIVVSGITGIILTSLYSHFQSRMMFSNLAVLNLFTVFVLTFLLRLGYYFSDTKWLAFALFVLMGPLNIIALVGFWGTVGRIFDLRQGKRIFGFIDTGQVVGVIISSFSIPFLITVGFKTKDLLYVSAISIFLALLFQLVIGSRHSDKLKIKAEKLAKRSSFADTLRIPYVRTMAIFVVLSMLVAFFVHFLFLAVASDRFDNPDEMAKYFGGLMGSLTFVSVLIKTFVYGPLMKTYGLKISLLVSPVVMTIVTGSAAIVGSFFGFTLESATFTFFFLLISLSKFFQKALKDSIEGPVLKLIYQSLPPAIRHEVQARVDGTINETAALASGVILALLGLFAVITLLHYVYILIGLIVVWFFVSIRLFSGYRKTLKQTLDKASTEDKVTIGEEEKWFKSIEKHSIGQQFYLLEVSKPWLIPQYIKQMLTKVSGEQLGEVCQIINQKVLVELLEILKSRFADEQNPEDKKILLTTIEQLEGLSSNANSDSKISELLGSKDYNDRVLAAKLIGLTTKADIRQKLTFLLRDLVPQVKKQAIWSARVSDLKRSLVF
jgi:ATP:ADP antiporter, AAA family